MAEWIGQHITGWPVWTIIIVLVLASILYLSAEVLFMTNVGDGPISQWFDRRRREKELKSGKK